MTKTDNTEINTKWKNCQKSVLSWLKKKETTGATEVAKKIHKQQNMIHTGGYNGWNLLNKTEVLKKQTLTAKNSKHYL